MISDCKKEFAKSLKETEDGMKVKVEAVVNDVEELKKMFIKKKPERSQDEDNFETKMKEKI